MPDFSPPLLAANDLSGLGRLAHSYREDQMRNELARYMHDKLSAADAARARTAQSEISSRERINMAPWDRGVTPSEVQRNQLLRDQMGQNLEINKFPWTHGLTPAQAAELKFRKDQSDQAERLQMNNLILGSIGNKAMTPEEAIYYKQFNDSALADADKANADRDNLITQWTKATPPEIYQSVTGKPQGSGFMGLGKGSLTPAQIMKAATDTTKAHYGDRVVLDPSTGRFNPIPQMTKPQTDIQRLLPILRALNPNNESLNNLFQQIAPKATSPPQAAVAPRATVGPDGKLRFNAVVTPEMNRLIQQDPLRIEPIPNAIENTPGTSAPLFYNPSLPSSTDPFVMERQNVPGSPRTMMRRVPNQNQLVPEFGPIPGSPRSGVRLVPKFPTAPPQAIPNYVDQNPWDIANEFFPEVAPTQAPPYLEGDPYGMLPSRAAPYYNGEPTGMLPRVSNGSIRPPGLYPIQGYLNRLAQ